MARSENRGINPLLRPGFGLSEPEQVHIMLLPHLNLAQLLACEEWDSFHIASIASVFNVALALAYLNRDARSIAYYGGVQNLIVELTNGRSFAAEEKRRLRRVFSEADKYVCAQKKSDILFAIRMVECQVENSPPGEARALDAL